MTPYKWNLVGILNEISELIDVIFEVEDEVVQEQLISFLEDYRSMIIKRRNQDDTREDRVVLREIKKKTRMYRILCHIFDSKKCIKSIKEYPIFEYKDTLIRILVRILEMETFNRIDYTLLTYATYDEIVDSVLRFLEKVDESYRDLIYGCIEKDAIEIRRLRKNNGIAGQSICIYGENYIYVNDRNKTPNYSLGPIIAHESGHVIHDSANSNVKTIILEVISITMELMYIDSLPNELYRDKVVLKEKFFSDYLICLEQLLTQITLKDNILSIQDDRRIIYKNPFLNSKILHRNGLCPHLCYIVGDFYQGEAYSIGFLTALKIKEIYDEDQEYGLYILKKIISLDCAEEEILIFLEELGIFDDSFISRVRNLMKNSAKAYKKIKE